METIVTAPVITVPNPFSSREDYLSMKNSWALIKTPTAAQHLMYNILRGKFPKRGFTPATNKIKLANGHAPEYAFTTNRGAVKNMAVYLSDPDRKLYDGRTFRQVGEAFLLPFGPTVTFAMALSTIAKLE